MLNFVSVTGPTGLFTYSRTQIRPGPRPTINSETKLLSPRPTHKLHLFI